MIFAVGIILFDFIIGSVGKILFVSIILSIAIILFDFIILSVDSNLFVSFILSVGKFILDTTSVISGSSGFLYMNKKNKMTRIIINIIKVKVKIIIIAFLFCSKKELFFVLALLIVSSRLLNVSSTNISNFLRFLSF